MLTFAAWWRSFKRPARFSSSGRQTAMARIRSSDRSLKVNEKYSAEEMDHLSCTQNAARHRVL
jgi:hypothetical protein